MKPLTHRQRAEKVLRRQKLNPLGARITMVADETYPSELVEAAREAVAVLAVLIEVADLRGHRTRTRAALDALVRRLALYEEAP